MDERRKDTRYSVVDLEIQLKENRTPVGQIVNLSQGGLLVFCEKPLKRGSMHQFRVPFKRSVAGQIHFDFEGRVVWSNINVDTPSKHSMGIEFIKYPNIQTEFIQKMITQYGDDQSLQ